MKKAIILLLFIAGYGTISAQDTFQNELFSAETVLKYRSELELSKEQVRTIKKIYNDNITAFNSTKWDLDAMQVYLNKLVAKSKIDETAALSKMDEITKLEQQLKNQRLKMLIKIKNELTATQQEKLKELRQDTDLSVHKLTTSISEDPRIVIRGSASKDGKSPMYIILNKNGKPKYPSGKAEVQMKDIDPNNIETVTVLKGKAATAQYGKDGKNGVIVIKLKE
ncbi:TonB-dependent receptor plug domain-containing protein [Dokdonia sp.]|uniref:Spy/CpxP family protein refolding chaperone n=1 Tax=Dokdonia sp. TaxID=2024995 RepID=UPI003263526A